MSSISEHISEGKSNTIKHSNLYFHARLDDNKKNRHIIINDESLYRKYYDKFQPYIMDVELSDKQMVMYQYQPRKFCHDFYGNIDLWSLLLLINSMVSPTEFPKKQIRGFVNSIDELISSILTVEYDRLEENRRDMYRF